MMFQKVLSIFSTFLKVIGLGDAVNIKEKQQIYNIDGNKWISLRLDGSGFGKLVKALRRQKIIEKDGFSYRFAKCMQESCIMLMDKFNGVIGFTQSDEIIIFIPTRVIRGIQNLIIEKVEFVR